MPRLSTDQYPGPAAPPPVFSKPPVVTARPRRLGWISVSTCDVPGEFEGSVDAEPGALPQLVLENFALRVRA